jgi:IS4 transposase
VLCAWTVFLTHVPVARLSLAEILTLGRTRWQIELRFKRWKSHGKVVESRSAQPYHVLGDISAKLLALIVQH